MNLRTEIYKEEKESADGDKGTRVPVRYVLVGSALASSSSHPFI